MVAEPSELLLIETEPGKVNFYDAVFDTFRDFRRFTACYLHQYKSWDYDIAYVYPGDCAVCTSPSMDL